MRGETGSPKISVSWSPEIDYSRAPCLGADQKARGLWERDWLHLAPGARQNWRACAVIEPQKVLCVDSAISRGGVVLVFPGCMDHSLLLFAFIAYLCPGKQFN